MRHLPFSGLFLLSLFLLAGCGGGDCDEQAGTPIFQSEAKRCADEAPLPAASSASAPKP